MKKFILTIAFAFVLLAGSSIYKANADYSISSESITWTVTNPAYMIFSGLTNNFSVTGNETIFFRCNLAPAVKSHVNSDITLSSATGGWSYNFNYTDFDGYAYDFIRLSIADMLISKTETSESDMLLKIQLVFDNQAGITSVSIASSALEASCGLYRATTLSGIFQAGDFDAYIAGREDGYEMGRDDYFTDTDLDGYDDGAYEAGEVAGYEQGRDDYFTDNNDDGYDDTAYDAGESSGYAVGVNDSMTTSWLVSLIGVVDLFLNINIFMDVTIGWFFFFSLVLGAIKRFFFFQGKG